MLLLLALSACAGTSDRPDAPDAAITALDAESITAIDASTPGCPCGPDGGVCDPTTQVCITNTHDHPGIGRHTEWVCSPLPPDCAAAGDCSCIRSNFCTCTSGPSCWAVACTPP